MILIALSHEYYSFKYCLFCQPVEIALRCINYSTISYLLSCEQRRHCPQARPCNQARSRGRGGHSVLQVGGRHADDHLLAVVAAGSDRLGVIDLGTSLAAQSLQVVGLSAAMISPAAHAAGKPSRPAPDSATTLRAHTNPSNVRTLRLAA